MGGASGSVVCGWVVGTATLKGDRLFALPGNLRFGLLLEIKKGSVLGGLGVGDDDDRVKIVEEAEEESKTAIMGLFLILQFCDFLLKKLVKVGSKNENGGLCVQV